MSPNRRNMISTTIYLTARQVKLIETMSADTLIPKASLIRCFINAGIKASEKEPLVEFLKGVSDD